MFIPVVFSAPPECMNLRDLILESYLFTCGASNYDYRCDYDLNLVIDSKDMNILIENFNNQSWCQNKLSRQKNHPCNQIIPSPTPTQSISPTPTTSQIVTQTPIISQTPSDISSPTPTNTRTRTPSPSTTQPFNKPKFNFIIILLLVLLFIIILIILGYFIDKKFNNGIIFETFFNKKEQKFKDIPLKNSTMRKEPYKESNHDLIEKEFRAKSAFIFFIFYRYFIFRISVFC
jgi:hypothetical protein